LVSYVWDTFLYVIVCYNLGMIKKPLIMPDKTAQEDPEAWASFWHDYKNIRTSMDKEDRKEYNKKYKAEQTRKRRVAKLAELMAMFPDEVQYILHPETRPAPAVRQHVDPRKYYTPSK